MQVPSVEASRRFRQAAAILDWAEGKYDQPISGSDIQQVAAKEKWADMANFNMQLHGNLVSLMEERTEGIEIVRNTKAEAELDAWRRLNHKYAPHHPLRNIQLLERLLAPTQAGCSDVVVSSKSCEWFARDLATMCRTSGNRYTWCPSGKSVRRASVITLLCKLRPRTPLRNRD